MWIEDFVSFFCLFFFFIYYSICLYLFAALFLLNIIIVHLLSDVRPNSIYSGFWLVSSLVRLFASNCDSSRVKTESNIFAVWWFHAYGNIVYTQTVEKERQRKRANDVHTQRTLWLTWDVGRYAYIRQQTSAYTTSWKVIVAWRLSLCEKANVKAEIFRCLTSISDRQMATEALQKNFHSFEFASIWFECMRKSNYRHYLNILTAIMTNNNFHYHTRDKLSFSLHSLIHSSNDRV